MPRSCHSSWFDHPNNVWCGIQIMTLLIMQSPTVPCYLVPLKSIYVSQRSILEHPQPMFPPQCDRPSFKPTQNKVQNYISVYYDQHATVYIKILP
jgi:hypothetical protein